MNACVNKKTKKFQLTQATVLGDGLILRLQFEAGSFLKQSAVNRLSDTGLPDYIPSLNNNQYITVNGNNSEIIGIQTEDWNMPLPYINVPTNDGAISANTYFFLLAIEDENQNEIYVGPPIWSYFDNLGEIGTTISANQAITFNWRVPCPSNGKVNIYACTGQQNGMHNSVTPPLYGNLSRIASIPCANLLTPTSYKLTSFTGDNALFVPKGTSWIVTCKLNNVISMGASVSVNCPDSIVADEKGYSTASAPGFIANNLSVVGDDGFLAIPENNTATHGIFSFNKTIYISYTHGTNAPNNGTLATPYKTISYAMSQNSSQTNIRFCLLRGDTWPADVWTRAYWGTSLYTPTLFDSYWNNAYGVDTNQRPVVTYGDPYYDMVVKNLDRTYFLFQNAVDSTNSTHGNGDRPYIYFRGLAFRADVTYANTGTCWPSATAEDFVIISDCEFQNICLLGSYGVPQKNAPIGCMVHRSIVHSVHGSPNNTYPDTGSGGNSLVFPDKFINPWAGYASSGNNLIAPNQTYVRFFNVGSRWNASNWTITAKEGSTTETKTLTSHADSNGSYWNVSSSWSNTFTRSGVSLSLDPTGKQFVIRSGLGQGSTIYTVNSYNSTTRTAFVTPTLPVIDSTTRIAFLPLGYWSLGGHMQGIFVAHCGDWLFSQSTFDKNGWNWDDDTSTYNDIFNHNIYLSAMCRNVVIHSCYILRSNSVGLQQRGGGVTAYNVFSENPNGSNIGNSGFVYKNLYIGQGHYNATINNAPTYLPPIYFDFNIVLKAHGYVENRIPTGINFDGVTIYNCDEHSYAHGYIAVRHGTFVDAGGLDNGLRLPVPGKFIVYNNLIVNRPATAIDYQGSPYRTTKLQLQTNWQNNGLSVVDPVIADRVDWNYNAFRITSQNTCFNWPDYTGKVFTSWQSYGRDPNSILLNNNPTFTNGTYDMTNWATANTIGNTFDSIWQTLRSRPENNWSDFYDASNCFKAFAIAYKPTQTSVPPIDNSSNLGYYGVIDNRN